MRILPILITSAVLLYSCDKKETATQETKNVTAPISDSVPATDGTAVSEVQNPEAPAAVTANSSSDKPALNPEHGQPYHRCEIPVGAPIDSAPEQNMAPQPAPQQMQTNTGFNTTPISPSLSPATSAGPKPATNPPHGEAHHRCDLQVGAPLT